MDEAGDRETLPPTPGRVLIIDDEGPLRMVLRRYLEGVGWTVNDVPTAEQGVALLEASPTESPYDVVLCDLTMPGMGGIGFCRHLAENSPHMLTRVIIMTGNSGVASDEELHRFAIASVLQKPFSIRLLLERVNALRAQRS